MLSLACACCEQAAYREAAVPGPLLVVLLAAGRQVGRRVRHGRLLPLPHSCRCAHQWISRYQSRFDQTSAVDMVDCFIFLTVFAASHAFCPLRRHHCQEHVAHSLPMHQPNYESSLRMFCCGQLPLIPSLPPVEAGNAARVPQHHMLMVCIAARAALHMFLEQDVDLAITEVGLVRLHRFNGVIPLTTC